MYLVRAGHGKCSKSGWRSSPQGRVGFFQKARCVRPWSLGLRGLQSLCSNESLRNLHSSSFTINSAATTCNLQIEQARLRWGCICSANQGRVIEWTPDICTRTRMNPRPESESQCFSRERLREMRNVLRLTFPKFDGSANSVVSVFLDKDAKHLLEGCVRTKRTSCWSAEETRNFWSKFARFEGRGLWVEWAAAMRRKKIAKSMVNAVVVIGSVLRWSARLEVTRRVFRLSATLITCLKSPSYRYKGAHRSKLDT